MESIRYCFFMSENKAFTVTYELIESNTILVRTIFGQITMSEIIKLWEADIFNKRVTTDLKAVITDFSKGKNLSKMEERKNITAFYRKNVDFFKNIKIAVVLTDQSIAIPLLYEQEHQDIQHLAFSTIEAAMKWSKE